MLKLKTGSLDNGRRNLTRKRKEKDNTRNIGFVRGEYGRKKMIAAIC